MHTCISIYVYAYMFVPKYIYIYIYIWIYKYIHIMFIDIYSFKSWLSSLLRTVFDVKSSLFLMHWEFFSWHSKIQFQQFQLSFFFHLLVLLCSSCSSPTHLPFLTFHFVPYIGPWCFHTVPQLDLVFSYLFSPLWVSQVWLYVMYPIPLWVGHIIRSFICDRQLYANSITDGCQMVFRAHYQVLFWSSKESHISVCIHSLITLLLNQILALYL